MGWHVLEVRLDVLDIVSGTDWALPVDYGAEK
jgi:hypothetical protein